MRLGLVMRLGLDLDLVKCKPCVLRGGLDLADFLRKKVFRRSRIRLWFFVVFDYLLATATVNASLLKQGLMSAAKRKSYGISATRYRIAQQLLLPVLEKKRAAQGMAAMAAETAETDFDICSHFPEMRSKSEKNRVKRSTCVQCRVVGRRVGSMYECIACDVCLCLSCFKVYHRV